MIVLDCSAAVHMARRTPEGNALRSLILEHEKVISTQLYIIELASTFGKYVKQSMVSDTVALAYMVEASNLVDELIPIEENYIEAFHESMRVKHSAYDMLYLTLARRNAATLVTLDTRLMKLCEELGIDCVHLEDI